MKKALLLSVLLMGLLYGSRVFAGTGGTEFQQIYTTLTDWTTGYLGKSLAAGLFLTGLAMGIVRQSLIAIVMGIGGAMAVNYTPQILDAIVTALI